ncbi:hypothetical protein SteCoe_6359 [Stentor coeruleus]|uniref:Uncharacterized protein n=1 Tax=Stentor coeruleus TaxID=5963 RepID=A0A1R2CQA9_9CILI|nr:hypothetical protein SteCoe_6359 [Stentor coeruleus]
MENERVAKTKIFILSMIWVQLFCIYLSLISLLSRDWINMNGLFENQTKHKFLGCAPYDSCSSYYKELSKISAGFTAVTIFCGLLSIFSVYFLSKYYNNYIDPIWITTLTIMIFLSRFSVFIRFLVKFKIAEDNDFHFKLLGYGGHLWGALIIIELIVLIIWSSLRKRIQIKVNIEEDNRIVHDKRNDEVNNERNDLNQENQEDDKNKLNNNHIETREDEENKVNES